MIFEAGCPDRFGQVNGTWLADQICRSSSAARPALARAHVRAAIGSRPARVPERVAGRAADDDRQIWLATRCHSLARTGRVTLPQDHDRMLADRGRDLVVPGGDRQRLVVADLQRATRAEVHRSMLMMDFFRLCPDSCSPSALLTTWRAFSCAWCAGGEEMNMRQSSRGATRVSAAAAAAGLIVMGLGRDGKRPGRAGAIEGDAGESEASADQQVREAQVKPVGGTGGQDHDGLRSAPRAGCGRRGSVKARGSGPKREDGERGGQDPSSASSL